MQVFCLLVTHEGLGDEAEVVLLWVLIVKTAGQLKILKRLDLTTWHEAEDL